MRRLLTFSVLALATASFGLTIGDNAPPLKVASVVKGKKVDLSKGLHVVEFWATWCGPCKVSIPHLTEMAKTYKGKVDFTGVSVWEEGPDQLGQVTKFVNAMGPKMDYNVVFDGESKTMATSWMTAAKQNGIPAAFLVKDGKILWIGHPMAGLDKTIDQVLAGDYDMAAAKAAMDKQMADVAEAQKAQAELMEAVKPLSDAMQAKDYPAALKAIDDIEAAKPDLKPRLEPTRFAILQMTGDPALTDLAKTFAADSKADPMMLNQMAWSIVDPMSKMEKPNYDAALILAEAAAKKSDMKDPNILDTYGLALFKNGKKAEAIDVQTKAVALAKADTSIDPANVKELEDRLEMYKKSA